MEDDLLDLLMSGRTLYYGDYKLTNRDKLKLLIVLDALVGGTK